MHYALIESGLVVNVIVAEADFIGELPGQWVPAGDAGIGWSYTDGRFAPPAFATEAPPADWRITRLAFRKRFALAEKAALELASLDDATAPRAERAQAAALRAYLKDVDAAQYIDLADPDTVAGVRALEASQLLAAGRADVILTTPVQPEERP